MERINLEKFDVDLENKSITFSCCTETPYTRYDEDSKVSYDQILVINENTVDMERLNKSASLLFNHQPDKLLGVIERAWIENERVYVRARFSPNDDFAERIFNDIVSQIIKGVSIGYQVLDYEDKRDNGKNIRYVTRFLIYQVSVVTIAADINCGFRSLNIKELNNMEEEKKEIQPDEIPVEEDTTIKVEEELNPDSAENKEEKEVDELAELKKQVEALKAENEQLQRLCGDQEEKACNGDEEEIKAIAKDFDVPDEEVKSAIDKKLSTKQFKQIVKEKNFNINKKETNKMNREFSEFLKARNFDAPFEYRDFTGFVDSDLVGTTTTPLVAALDKRLGVKGYRVLSGLRSNISIPVQSGRISVGTKELCADADESNPSFGSVTLSPQKITAYTDVCAELLYNSNSDVESFIIDQLLKEIGYTIENKMLAAVKSGAATSITYSALDSITWKQILDCEAALDGYILNEPRFVLTPAARASLKSIPKAANSITGFICGDDNRINGYQANITGCATAGDNTIYFGDFGQLIAGFWTQGISILVDRYSLSTSGNLRIVGSCMFDCAVIQPDAFCKMVVQSSSSSSEAESSSSGD